ncbi:uncharacterized protein LOC113495484 [Trichoplusia ni]|uniref:Uncharacterized protein LOC113495484 n=1 Tax=Trichoplusia ni TaxID=7111 RepID=A0A7E5VNZ9_TRINI|nr:uncharacterized protein LOC113495484 [Trichoplusia ni]
MSFLYVRVYHGPDNAFLKNHKPQKYYGFRDTLQKMGFRVDLVPIDILNYVVMEICNHEVFRCSTKNMRFNTEFHRDPVCQRAISAVLDASRKFERARRYLWFWTLLETQQLRTNKFGPQDAWLEKIDIDYEYTSETKCCDPRYIDKKDRKDF